jgi:hypothetical protein
MAELMGMTKQAASRWTPVSGSYIQRAPTQDGRRRPVTLTDCENFAVPVDRYPPSSGMMGQADRALTPDRMRRDLMLSQTPAMASYRQYDPPGSGIQQVVDDSGLRLASAPRVGPRAGSVFEAQGCTCGLIYHETCRAPAISSSVQHARMRAMTRVPRRACASGGQRRTGPGRGTARADAMPGRPGLNRLARSSSRSSGRDARRWVRRRADNGVKEAQYVLVLVIAVRPKR